MPEDVAAVRTDIEISRTGVVQPEAVRHAIESDLASDMRANAENLTGLVDICISAYMERPVRLAPETRMELRKGKLVGTKASAENGILRH